jgi:hypothetical protein
VRTLFVATLTAAALSLSAAAQAGDCAIRVNRTPHPGKEVEAWAPYANRNPSAEMKAAKDLDECRKIAETNCTIKRKDVLLKKVVNARFDSTDVDGGGDLCKGVNP